MLKTKEEIFRKTMRTTGLVIGAFLGFAAATGNTYPQSENVADPIQIFCTYKDQVYWDVRPKENRHISKWQRRVIVADKALELATGNVCAQAMPYDLPQPRPGARVERLNQDLSEMWGALRRTKSVLGEEAKLRLRVLQYTVNLEDVPVNSE